MTVALIPARMTSARFPGKVLAPFRGRPMLSHVVERACAVLPPERVLVVTSDQVSDDDVAACARDLGVGVFRGSLDDVFERFRCAAREANATWAVRINADSPLMSENVVRAVLERAADPYDLVTTIAPRTLPKGQNPEAVRTSLLWSTDSAQLTADDREHVTAYYHRHRDRFRIRNVSSGRPDLAGLDLSVDTPEDLARLETMSDADVAALLAGPFHG